MERNMNRREILKLYHFRDEVFDFDGAVSVETTPEYAAPWRIDYHEKELYPVLKDGVGKYGAGIRLCFETDSRVIGFRLLELEEAALIDLKVNGKYEQTLEITEMETIIDGLAPEKKRIELWLPQNKQLKFAGVIVEESACIKKCKNEKKRWVHYGSSISQSNAATSPSRGWAAFTAERYQLALTNLGFSGECVFDPMIGRQIRELEADYITLKLGINTYGGLSTKRMFSPCVIGLIKTIREKHKKTPLVIISPIYCKDRETKIGASDLSLEIMREILQGIVKQFKEYGDENIYYMNGLNLLDERYNDYLSDGLHPDAEGQYIIADNFSKYIIEGIFGDQPFDIIHPLNDK